MQTQRAETRNGKQGGEAGRDGERDGEEIACALICVDAAARVLERSSRWSGLRRLRAGTSSCDMGRGEA